LSCWEIVVCFLIDLNVSFRLLNLPTLECAIFSLIFWCFWRLEFLPLLWKYFIVEIFFERVEAHLRFDIWG
jgi:hypothetical protein